MKRQKFFQMKVLTIISIGKWVRIERPISVNLPLFSAPSSLLAKEKKTIEKGRAFQHRCRSA
ncbi:MAG: hypothetical protein AAGE99_02895 [Chlamydiota bacterium]